MWYWISPKTCSVFSKLKSDSPRQVNYSLGEVEVNHCLTDCKHCISQKFDWSGYMFFELTVRNRRTKLVRSEKRHNFHSKPGSYAYCWKIKLFWFRIMRYFECTWLVSISNWTSFELSPWVWQAQLSPTASVDDITELYNVALTGIKDSKV